MLPFGTADQADPSPDPNPLQHVRSAGLSIVPPARCSAYGMALRRWEYPNVAVCGVVIIVLIAGTNSADCRYK